MRKLMLLTTATLIACATIFIWSHGVVAPLQASPTQSINPTEMMQTYKGSLPIEQWDAI
jgi:hypothetical protein